MKDLCARLPYGVKIELMPITRGKCITLTPIILRDYFISDDVNYLPYLRPLSSMTEEEKNELSKNFDFYIQFPTWKGDCKIINLRPYGINQHLATNVDNFVLSMLVDWLNAHHFDYRGLIKKGLALEAPENMYDLNK